MAELFKSGIIDKTGKFVKDIESPRVRKGEQGDEYVLAWANETSVGRDVTITIKDVRAVQLAKGAMYAGAKIMMQKLGYDALDRVVLAGAFGSFIDREESLVIGMFPDVPVDEGLRRRQRRRRRRPDGSARREQASGGRRVGAQGRVRRALGRAHVREGIHDGHAPPAHEGQVPEPGLGARGRGPRRTSVEGE